MLLENIHMPENLPFTLSFSNVAEEGFHYHKEMEILLMLKGTARCKVHNVLYELRQGDVLIIDTQDMHRIYDSSDNVLMLDMYVDLGYFENLYPDIEYMIFACEDYSKASSLMLQEQQRKLSMLKHHIAKTALSYFNEIENHELQLKSIDDLIFNLVNQFQGFFIEDYKFKADQSHPEDVDLARLYKIIKYIYLNYDKKITLDDLSQMLYLSPYYISHLIKNTSGLSFQNFLNYVRLEYAEKMLAESGLNLTEISRACGFSSLSYFNKCFRTWYDMTPSQYRQQVLPSERSFHGEISFDEGMALLKEYLFNMGIRGEDKVNPQFSQHIFIPVRVDFRSGKAFDTTFPLNITISTQEDVLMLSRQKEKIKALKPEALLLDCGNLFAGKKDYDVTGLLNMLFISGLSFYTYNEGSCIDKSGRNILADSGISSVHSLPAMQSRSLLIGDNEKNGPRENCSTYNAYDSITKLPKKTIALSGPGRALFTAEGLPTPYYYVYSIFSEIKGTITEQREQYMIVKDEDNICILIAQGDSASGLKAHVRISGLSSDLAVSERIFEQKHSSLSIIDSMSRSFILSATGFSYAEQFSQGSLNLYSLSVSGDFEIDYILEPNSFAYINISRL